MYTLSYAMSIRKGMPVMKNQTRESIRQYESKGQLKVGKPYKPCLWACGGGGVCCVGVWRLYVHDHVCRGYGIALLAREPLGLRFPVPFCMLVAAALHA